MKIIGTYSNWQAIHDHIMTLASHATPEKAHCAKGRMNFWLQAEPNYSTKTYMPAYQDDRLWQFCKRIMPNADLAQIFYGNQGIDWHRDAAYANNTAVIINLGKCDWQLKPNGVAIESHQLTGGEIITFNCKQLHRCIPSSDRIGIGLWSAKIAIPSDLGSLN